MPFVIDNGNSDVTIVIPTKNSARTLSKCLKSIHRQTYEGSIGIIVVDANSSDDTIKIASSFNTKILYADAERSASKNIAIPYSTGLYILFLDSDMVLEPNVIQECVNACSHGEAIGVIIPEKSIGSSFWVKVRDFERGLYVGSRIESPRFFVKENVVRVGGFDEDIVAYEEATLPQKLEAYGYYVRQRISSFILHDEGDFNLKRWLRKKKYYMKTAREYSEKYHNYSLEQFGIMYRLRTIFAADNNWKSIMRHPLLFVGVLTLKTLELAAWKRI